jgi:hypothetical protein
MDEKMIDTLCEVTLECMRERVLSKLRSRDQLHILTPKKEDASEKFARKVKKSSRVRVSFANLDNPHLFTVGRMRS